MDDNEHGSSGYPPEPVTLTEDETDAGEAVANARESLVTGEVRIAAVTAAIAAGLAPEEAPPHTNGASTPARAPSESRSVPGAPSPRAPGVAPKTSERPEFAPFRPSGERAAPAFDARSSTDALEPGDDVLAGIVLPDWTDPPTGQVPRVLLEDPDGAEEVELVRGPSWREDASDWDDLPDHLTYLAEASASETAAIAGREPENATGEHDLFGLNELDAALAGEPEEASTPWQELIDQARRRSRGSRRKARRTRRREVARVPAPSEAEAPGASTRPTPAPSRRSPVIATATGVVFGILAAGCFLGGSAATLGLVVLVLVLATAEVCAALRRAGYVPATLVCLLAVPALVIGAYVHGPTTIVLVLALSLFCCAVWALRGLGREEPLANLALSGFIIVWVGLLGAFAGLILAPSTFRSGHGVAVFAAAVICTVAHDIGSYVVGSRLGRHRLAPRLSPGKSVEGLFGGTLLTVGVGIGLITRIHPFDLGDAIGLALLVSVLAPLGDLFESLVKRDLNLKDMGHLLPGHGGVFDRIDAMLFVLPASYYLVRLVHFG